MLSQNFTNYCVSASFALCYIYILRFFYFIYICLKSMPRHRTRHFENIKLQQLSNKDLAGTFDEKKLLLQHQHEILQTKYNCLKELFHVYTANLHYKNTIQAIKRKECLKKPEPKNYSNCKTNFSSKCTDFENPKLSTVEPRNGTNITNLKYEKSKIESYDKSKKLRNVAIQTDNTNHPITIASKAGHHALNIKGNSKLLENETETRLNSKMSVIKNYIQKVLGQVREPEKPTRIRSRRHISFSFAKKSSHKNVVPNNCSVDNNPLIVSLVEVARKSCEADKSVRTCRFYGCGYVCYGLIEYNDHMNSHYPERKYICYFCHESFDKASHKFLHENKHLGVKFDLTSSKSDVCCKKHINREPQDDLEESSVDFKLIRNHEAKDVIRNARSKDINATMTGSDLTLTSILKTYKASRKRKQKCQHTISSVNQSEDIELSECVSSKNLSKLSTKYPDVDKIIEKISCRFCSKSFDSKCKLLYHINLKHAYLFPSDTDISSHKENMRIEKSQKYLGCKDSNSKSTDSACVSNLSKKLSKVGSVINRVKNGFHKYKWEPGTKIIRI